MELRKGDKVSVTGTVKYTPTGGERIFVKIEGSHEELWCSSDAVKLVQAKFEIGDRVAFDGFTGEVIAINGDFAWIVLSVDGSYTTRHFGSITRLPEPETEAEPEVVEPPPAPGSSD